jgi:sulfur-carrier protein
MTELVHHVRVQIPYHLRNLARVDGEFALEVAGPVTIGSVLDALERRYPMLCGTIREHDSLKRRAFLRFFACEEDWSHHSAETELPEAIASGKEPFLIIGAIAGG